MSYLIGYRWTSHSQVIDVEWLIQEQINKLKYGIETLKTEKIIEEDTYNNYLQCVLDMQSLFNHAFNRFDEDE